MCVVVGLDYGWIWMKEQYTCRVACSNKVLYIGVVRGTWAVKEAEGTNVLLQSAVQEARLFGACCYVGDEGGICLGTEEEDPPKNQKLRAWAERRRTEHQPSRVLDGSDIVLPLDGDPYIEREGVGYLVCGNIIRRYVEEFGQLIAFRDDGKVLDHSSGRGNEVFASNVFHRPSDEFPVCRDDGWRNYAIAHLWGRKACCILIMIMLCERDI